MSTAAGESQASPLILAQQRAMPLTRLLDGGMDHADATLLMAATSTGEPWDVVAERIGGVQQVRADAALATGRIETARMASRRATAAFLFAQMAFNDDTDRKRTLHARYTQAMAHHAELSDPPVERLELAHDGGRLVGWLTLPPGGVAGATVIVWGGLSGWGAAYLDTARNYNARGMACLLAEGPGQGESRLHGGLFLDGGVAAGFARFVDAVQADDRLGPGIGVQGNSFGGLYAGLLAATDRRIGACCVNGAPARPAVPEFRAAREQIFAATGTSDAEQAQAVLAQLHFDPGERPIACPVLVLHGGRDPLATLDQQLPFVEAAGDHGILRVWDDGEHTLYNHAEERDAAVGDWFAETLAR